jgi:hypothetical protein
MPIEIEKSNKEMWFAKNITPTNITIGDLPLLPVIKPDKTVNLLRFYSREKIVDSQMLTFLVQNKKITIEKKEQTIEKNNGC